MKRFFHKPTRDAASADTGLQTHEIRRLDISSMIDLAIEMWRPSAVTTTKLAILREVSLAKSSARY